MMIGSVLTGNRKMVKLIEERMRLLRMAEKSQGCNDPDKKKVQYTGIVKAEQIQTGDDTK